MADRELEITIAPDGKVTVRTKGIKGEACMQYADLLVQIVGREEERQRTAEFYEHEHGMTQTHINIEQRR
jgi:hypothetical protein